MKQISAVIFDLDGVIIDSLQQHLDLCEKLAKKFGLQLMLPNANTFKEQVRNGLLISPMHAFFTAVGFPNNYIEEAKNYYNENFKTQYAPKMFTGISDLLLKLYQSNLKLFIVSANTVENIVSVLGDLNTYFEEIHGYNTLKPQSKSIQIRQIIKKYNLAPEAVLYIGDQLSDYNEAQKAQVIFLATTYGWCFTQKDQSVMDVATSPEEIGSYIQEKNSPKTSLN